MSLLNTLHFIASHPLNENYELKAFCRFLKWQIGSRLIDESIVYSWINNSKFYVRRGETGLTGNVYTGLHEFVDMSYLLHILRPDDLFVDVGANLGSYTILAGAVIGSKVYSFEPVPSTYERLRQNIRLNEMESNVNCFNVAIGNQLGAIEFTSDLDTVNHVVSGCDTDIQNISVEISMLDKILEKEFPSLIKIDVEGYETPVIFGAEKVLKKESLHSIIIELNGAGMRYGFDESEILKMMLDYQFEPYSYDPFARNLTRLECKNSIGGNTLFIRNKSFVLDRIRTSPKYYINNKYV